MRRCVDRSSRPRSSLRSNPPRERLVSQLTVALRTRLPAQQSRGPSAHSPTGEHQPQYARAFAQHPRRSALPTKRPDRATLARRSRAFQSPARSGSPAAAASQGVFPTRPFRQKGHKCSRICCSVTSIHRSRSSSRYALTSRPKVSGDDCNAKWGSTSDRAPSCRMISRSDRPLSSDRPAPGVCVLGLLPSSPCFSAEP